MKPWVSCLLLVLSPALVQAQTATNESETFYRFEPSAALSTLGLIYTVTMVGGVKPIPNEEGIETHQFWTFGGP